MERYTIYCTEEQTKKALKLGAPIERGHKGRKYFNIEVPTFFGENHDICYVIFIPTAEQMLEWLEEQKISIDITMASKRTAYYTLSKLTDNGMIFITGRSENNYASRKKATLAAIDAALDYLIEKK